MPFRFAILSSCCFLLLCPVANAQLIRDEVRDDRRICTYVGSEPSPDGTGAAERSLAQEPAVPCPITLPYRDPNPPGNAALRRETTTAVNRLCVYEQGGIEYEIGVPLAVRCAMTPALLAQAQTR